MEKEKNPQEVNLSETSIVTPQEQKNNFAIPISILLAGFVIAGAVYLSNKSSAPVVNVDNSAKSDILMQPISKTDHILGNPDATVSIVEYSDTECPFCKRFQTTMQTIMDTYGKDGKVDWVYREFPLDMHPKSRNESEAIECVNELGGNAAFWKMLDTIYANTPSNNGLDVSLLPVFAKQAGVDVAKFNDCLSSGKFASTVEAYVQDGIKAGVSGTPYSVLVLKNSLSSDAETTIQNYVLNNNLAQNVTISPSKDEIALNGALPVEDVKAILDAIVK